ncbi:hypothetical protein ACFS32_05105 [Novosphingobium pokkalii]|uniref:hypothetical protein n=1 Tax=Novosphingobium pokkalii TaxID=1770194 RepID=UPI00362DCD80
MIYVRGLPQDYEGWRQLGCEGWSWSDVLPYFRAAERQERGADEWHGDDGPLAVGDLTLRHPMTLRLREAFIQAESPPLTICVPAIMKASASSKARSGAGAGSPAPLHICTRYGTAAT